jgi:hypothetical protein
MCLTLSSQVLSYFIIQVTVDTQGFVIIQQLGVSLNVVFLIEIVGTNPGILFDDKENCH